MTVDAGVAFVACLSALFALAGAMSYFAGKARAHGRPEWREIVAAQQKGLIERALWGVVPQRDWLTEQGQRSARIVDGLLWLMLVALVGIFVVAAIATRKIERWLPCETVFRVGCVAPATPK